MFDLSLLIALILIGLVCGKIIECLHFKKLKKEESRLNYIKECNLKNISGGSSVKDSFLVDGSVCIATDYFKNFVSGIRNVFGGEMRSYESLMIRARREALIRMKQKAELQNAAEVWNIRFETATIQGKNRSAGIEVIAYGTAVTR